MDLVPKDEMLLIETEIMPNLIDRVEVDDLVDIRFSNFSLTPLLVVPGRFHLFRQMFSLRTKQKSHTTLHGYP